MGERQKHGFNFEKYIANKFGVILSDNYTSKWDGKIGEYPVSIKLEKYGSDIELADFKRNATNKESFYLIVGFWKENKDNIVKIETLFIDGEDWHSLFPQRFIEDFDKLLASISNDKSDDKLWKELITKQRNQWKTETSNLIRPRFKRDHKKQKRIQCAINNKDFYNHFIPKYSVSLKESR